MSFLEVLLISNSSKNYIEKLLRIEQIKMEINNFNSRELYIIDGTYSFDISSMVIKKNCILLKLDFIRAIIYEDKIYLLNLKLEEFCNIKQKINTLINNFDNSRSFHLYFIDFLFTEICDYFDKLIHNITPKICNSNELIRNGTYIYKDFILLQSDLLNLEFRIKELKNMTDELLDNKDDLESINFNTDEELINNTEDMIENYSLKFQDLDNDVSRLTREMDNVQKLVNIDLAKKRNSYAIFNIYISIVSVAISLGSFIGSMFGMNIKNNIEKSNHAFIIVFMLTLLIILLSVAFQIFHFFKLK